MTLTTPAMLELIEKFFGLRGPSLSEQMARDMKLGIFPKKSEQTLAEESEASQLHELIKSSVKAGAPGLSDTTCGAIAQSVVLKLRHALRARLSEQNVDGKDVG